MTLFQRIASFFMAIITTIIGFFHPVPVKEDKGKWLLENVPAFEAGYTSSALFNTGTGLDQEVVTNLVPEPDPTYSYMQIIRKTRLSDVQDYREKLTAAGYTQSFENQIENNYYYAYTNDDRQVYFYYNGYSGETRVIDDCCNTTPLSDFSYTTDKTATVHGEAIAPTVYQFSYPYKDEEHPDEDLYATNGMLYVVLLSDGKVIVIDGGAKRQSSDQNIEEFWSWLHEITGKKENAKINIAMWYGTHCHGDHNNFFTKFLRHHYKKVNLERVMFNYQAESVIATGSGAKNLRQVVAKRYPDTKYLKVRAGYAFQLQDAQCEVIYTHEDFVAPNDATWTADNANDASAVLRMTLGGKTFLFLGDSYGIAESYLLRKYTAATLHADVLQAAHHLYNDLIGLYDVVRPTYVMCPQSKYRAEMTPMPAYTTLRKTVPAENFFFANQNIVYGFTPKADGAIAISERAVNCVPYDGSTIF